MEIIAYASKRFSKSSLRDLAGIVMWSETNYCLFDLLDFQCLFFDILFYIRLMISILFIYT